MTRQRTRPPERPPTRRRSHVTARRGKTEGHGEPVTLQRAQRIHAMYVSHAHDELARYDAVWQDLSPMEQRLDRAQARRRRLGTLPTIFELWAEAHERLTQFLAIEPGRYVLDTLPPALIDILVLDAGLRQQAEGAPWIIRGWAYDPAVQGLLPMDGFWIDDVADIVRAARRWPGTRDAPLPIYTEDQALRTALAAACIPLGARLTQVVATPA